MKKLLFFVLVVAHITVEAKLKYSPQAYILSYKTFAIAAMHQSNIPASVTLAIALVESGNGGSRVCKKLNNHFGVKGRNSGKIKSAYKEYPNPQASYNDYVRIISSKKFYKKLSTTTDIRQWVLAIEKSGYSEVPGKWSKKILQTISLYKLTAYDKE